jgi:hypothetical protein
MRFNPDRCPACGRAPRGIIEAVEVVASLILDETGAFDYDGNSDVQWNGQAPIVEDGKVTLICSECGEQWPATMATEEAALIAGGTEALPEDDEPAGAGEEPDYGGRSAQDQMIHNRQTKEGR